MNDEQVSRLHLAAREAEEYARSLGTRAEAREQEAAELRAEQSRMLDQAGKLRDALPTQ